MHDPPLPFRSDVSLLPLFIAFSIGVTAMLGLISWNSYRTLSEFATQELELLRATGRIVHLDEVLTMSARMTAATGDTHWADRYDAAEPQLQRAIDEARRLAPQDSDLQALDETDVANQRLVALEQECLRLVRAGRAEEAGTLVFGPEYEALKRRYSAGVDAVIASFRARTDRRLRTYRTQAVAGGVLSGTGVLLIAVMIIEVVRRTARVQAMHHRLLVFGRRHTMVELASGLSHEINQPVTSVVNYCDAATRLLRTEAPDLDRVRAAVAGASREARRVGEITRRIRQFTTDQRMDRTPTELEACVRDAVTLVRGEARRAGASIEVDGCPQAIVSADAVLLQQVLVNLLANAVAALRRLPDDADRAIRIKIAPASGGYDVLISDNGPGFGDLPPETAFEPFMTTREQGMGLGLAISRGIVESHHGRLHARREDGWTTFHVHLPSHFPESEEP